jgi:hypothetical protein
VTTGTERTRPLTVEAERGASCTSSQRKSGSPVTRAVRSASHPLRLNSACSCRGRSIITSMSVAEALSLTLYWLESWSAVSIEMLTGRPSRASISGSRFVIALVHTWFTAATRSGVSRGTGPDGAPQPAIAAPVPAASSARNPRRFGDVIGDPTSLWSGPTGSTSWTRGYGR